MKLSAIIVIYNQSCKDSLTCSRLLSMEENLQVLIYDNSTTDYGNREFCREQGWVYLGGEGNLGLSKAYNACIDHLSEAGFEGIVCLLDDDTQITAAYFSAVKEAAQAGGQLFVPFVYANGRILSPCRLTHWHKPILFPNEQAAKDYSGTDMSAINSGMAMAFSLFTHYRYDENIFLDGIDHTHLRRLGKAGVFPRVLAVRFDHCFSGDEKPPMSGAMTRFRLFAKDYRYIFRKEMAGYWYLVGKRALHLTLQYKTLGFFNILLKTGFSK